jgi:sugar lactone lactonase YvrE
MVANIPDAALLKGVAFARPGSEQLLVADSFRGLIWNVNVSSGAVGVAFNDSTTKGPGTTGATLTGVNGLKVYNDTMYWTNTGGSSFYMITIDEDGNPPAGAKPTQIASRITAGVDDFVVDHEGTAYICGPWNAITKVSPKGEQEIIAGTFNSASSTLGGPSAARFGKLVSDKYSLYVTTNGGMFARIPSEAGISRIDIGYS